MEDLLPELCDRYPDDVRILEPMLGNFGGRERFSGQIVTIKA
jgi:regulator of ribonuclease activity A